MLPNSYILSVNSVLVLIRPPSIPTCIGGSPLRVDAFEGARFRPMIAAFQLRVVWQAVFRRGERDRIEFLKTFNL